MGSGRWSASEWGTYTTSRSYSTKSTKEIYGKTSLDEDLNPKGVALRESRDSDDNPASNAVIVGLDVTGSMHSVLDVMARQGLNTLATEVYERKPVEDPHIMCMGIGDVAVGDQAPLQVTQFEADIRIAKQLEKIYLEGGGGGNMFESYALAWYFAAMHTGIDCFDKRGKKGYLFTVGDECPTPQLTADEIQRVTGDNPERTLTGVELFDMVSRQYEVFHLVVEEGSNFRHMPERVYEEWTELLGQRALSLKDHTKMAEVIVSTIQINEGFKKAEVIESWDGTTAIAVDAAVRDLDTSKAPNASVMEL